MFSRKFSSNIRRKKRMITSLIILLVVSLGIGYSAFTSNLSIDGELNVSKYDHTLYGVLEKAAKKGTYAKEYTGSHQDSMAGVGPKKIYHWYGSSDANGTAILDMNNVIFADHCWQMIRTTDTGGVKLVYNGEPENNQCLNTRGTHVGYAQRTTQSMSTTYYYGTSYTYDKENNVFSLDGTVTTGTIQTGQYTCKQTTSSGTCATLYLVDTVSSGTTYYVLPLNGNSNYSQFGTLQFNQNYNSPSYVGYMYNTVYPYNSKSPTSTNVLTRTSMTNGTSYYYGTGFTYDTTTNQYTLTGTTQATWTNTYSSSSGLYTCRSATATSCSTVYYIAGGASSYMYGFSMSGGNLLSYYNTNIVLGTSYTESSGTYTLGNTTTITKADWFSNYATYKNYYTCGDDTTSCTNLKYTTSTDNYRYYALSLSNNYIYANDFTYNSGTGTYTLGSDRVQTWNMTDTDKSNLSTHHYTCFNDTGECTTLSYVYYASTPSSSSYIYYINLAGGKSVEDAIDEMLYDDNVNTTNSTIKIGIDAWYKRYMTGYTSKLEDTIFCNDRSQSNSSTNGWNPDGGNVTTYLYFKNYNSNSDLSCTNTTDKFSLANTKAKLTYPVGLLTYPETYLLNNSNIRKTGQGYWLGSPNRFHIYYAYERYVITTGGDSGSNVINAFGLRPSVSLATGTEYTSGSGSMADPYVVE